MKFFELAILGGSEQAKLYLLRLGNRNLLQTQCLLGELYFEKKKFVKDEKKVIKKKIVYFIN
jgi:hypothetical protein